MVEALYDAEDAFLREDAKALAIRRGVTMYKDPTKRESASLLPFVRPYFFTL